MRNDAKKETLNAWRNLFLATSEVVALGVLGVLTAWAQSQASQSSATQSLVAMEAAGVKMSFDAASVKQNKSASPSVRTDNIGGLYRDAPYSHTGGLFSATNTNLLGYIMFAYDLTSYQMLRLISSSPKWTSTNPERYDIQARAEGNPTRAQMQLMMQSLLADRFKLAVHTETQEVPVYALVLAKPGKTGPQLQPDNKPCPTEPTPADPKADFPTACGLFEMQASVPGRVRSGWRHVTMESYAAILAGPAIGVDRPVVDRTGLIGPYDLSIEFVLERNEPRPDSSYDPTGPTYVEAMQEQLGLKLEPTKGPVDVLVIDHVEEPSPN